jgi:hypothetical protein
VKGEKLAVKKKTSKTTSMARRTSRATQRPEWLDNPDVIVFAGDVQLPVGGMELHGLGEWADRFLGRSKEEVQADWNKVVDQMKSLLDQASAAAKDYNLSEITFQLGFSAEGQIVFVAKAGVTTTISAKFTRKQPGVVT